MPTRVISHVGVFATLIALFNTSSIVTILMFAFTLRAAGSFFPYAVSYTHLDVYKRQHFRFPFLFLLLRYAPDYKRSLIQYTHDPIFHTSIFMNRCV